MPVPPVCGVSCMALSWALCGVRAFAVPLSIVPPVPLAGAASTCPPAAARRLQRRESPEMEELILGSQDESDSEGRSKSCCVLT